jgi:hypothetical protein
VSKPALSEAFMELVGDAVKPVIDGFKEELNPRVLKDPES